MVLHLETKDLSYGEFFDRDNATIGLLQDLSNALDLSSPLASTGIGGEKQESSVLNGAIAHLRN